MLGKFIVTPNNTSHGISVLGEGLKKLLLYNTRMNLESMKKMFVFDLDGTCLNNNECITDNLRELIQKLNDNNYVVVATGRSFSDSFRYYRQLNINTEIICYNGAFIYDPKSMKVLSNLYMKEHNKIFQFLKTRMNEMLINNIVVSKGIETFRIGDENRYLCDMMYDEELPNTIIDIEKMRSILEGVHRIVVSVAPKMRKLLAKQIEDEFTQVNVYSWRGREDIVDISIRGIDKWDAITHLATLSEIDVKNIITFGDSDNDVQMIKNANIGVCMRNGSNAAKAVANQITKFDNDNDGVYKHLLQMMEAGI